MRKIEIEKNKAELEFEKALELRNFEIDKFWIRGWFFGALLVAIFAGYIDLHKDECEDCNKYLVYVSFLGFVVSLSQTLMNRGSKYWQERWEYHTKHKESILGIDVTKTEKQFANNNLQEKDLIEAYILAKGNGENFLTRSARFSVSKFTFFVWDIITFFCFCAWLKDFVSCFLPEIQLNVSSPCFVIAFHIIVIIYAIYFFNSGEAYESLGKNLEPRHKVTKNINKETISRQDLQDIYPAGKLEEL